MTPPTATDVAVQRAEEDAHVDEEMRNAGLQGGEVTLDDIREKLGEGSTVSGVTSSAEMMTVYNRYDGVPSQITSDQAGQRLRVRFDKTHPWAGQLVWTTKPPENGPALGTLLCPLHKDSDERAYLDSLHFQGKLCLKATLKTEYDKDMHFKQHKLIFNAVEADKAKQLQLQQMELMREQTNAMKAMAEAQGAPPATETAQPTDPEPASSKKGKASD